MGMTIDKTIEFFNGLECHTPQAKDARDVAVDTMRKYQKIEEIVQRYEHPDKEETDKFYWDIIGVVENGNLIISYQDDLNIERIETGSAPDAIIFHPYHVLGEENK